MVRQRHSDDICDHRHGFRFAAEFTDFRKLVFSHGWVHLAPFQWTEQDASLSRSLTLSNGIAVKVKARTRAKLNGSEVVVTCRTTSPLSVVASNEVRSQVRRMLRLNESFADFHRACADDHLLSFVSRIRCGGMLRGPTAFEDLVKTVCTTNCDWRNTKRMCERLCGIGGDAFPTPTAILRLSEARLAEQTSLGYRAKTVWDLARLTLDGKLPLDEWASLGDFARIRAALKSIWGIGPYSLNHMLVLLGDYSEIPVDCEIIKYLRKTHFDGRNVSAKEAVAPYERYGKLRYLAFKFGRMSRVANYINKG